MQNDSSRPSVLAAVDDIFFSAKIESAARAMGVKLELALDAGQLEERLSAAVPALIILDLNSRACEPLAAIGRLKADSRLADVPIVGFLAHVQVELEQAARAAGCDRVLPRSLFSAKLPEILKMESAG